MALGLSTGTSGAEFIPHIRYDARAGRLFRADRTQGSDGRWQTTMVDISNPPPQFLMDLAQIEIGWLSYTGGTPDLQMVPFGAALPPPPSKEHRQGFRVRVFAPKLLGGLREFASSAKVVISAMDVLHSAYEAAPERSQGLVPVVSLAGTTPVSHERQRDERHARRRLAPAGRRRPGGRGHRRSLAPPSHYQRGQPALGAPQRGEPPWPLSGNPRRQGRSRRIYRSPRSGGSSMAASQRRCARQIQKPEVPCNIAAPSTRSA
jgi:hypothetical protein